MQDTNRSLPVVLDDGGRKYVYGLGLAYAVQNVNGTERLQVYHPDGLGSVRAITDSAGAIVETYRADEFGVPLEEQGRLTQPYQYTGEPRDASGLVFLRARYYDPAVGRFVSRDERRGSRNLPGTLNRCAYAGNNPTSRIDPAGTEADPPSAALRGEKVQCRGMHEVDIQEVTGPANIRGVPQIRTMHLITTVSLAGC